MRKVFYTWTGLAIFARKTWAQMCPDIPMPVIEQKAIDAKAALTDFEMYESAPISKALLQRTFPSSLRPCTNGIGAYRSMAPRSPSSTSTLTCSCTTRSTNGSAGIRPTGDLALMLLRPPAVRALSIDEIERENILFPVLRCGIETTTDFLR